MNTLITLCLMAFVAGACAQCPPCKSMKWAMCDGNPCECKLNLDETLQQKIDCTQMVPKCFLMKAEMYRRRKGQDTRSIGGKPVETALNDGIYDPECENNGRFKAVQCNGTETCWCVNSAGVRRSDKGDKNIRCEPADTYWVRLELKHKPLNVTVSPEPAKWKTALENALLERYNLDKKFVKEVQYDRDSRMIVVDVKKEKGDASTDLPRMAYYMEKDVKVSPLFSDKKPFLPTVEGTSVPMESILVYYVDDKAPTITMQRLTGGVIAVIVGVVLAVLIGLLALYFMRR